ncbi:MAG: type III-B CRISPR-associated protein Cas10/Cmr2, partial [Candidatus Aenigmatarchaeota archaeon]
MEWKLKLKALLHDPPYKMLIFENGEKERVNKILSKVIHKDQDDHNLHEIWAEDLLNYVFFDECIKDNNIELADKIASAQSRIIVKPQFRKEEQEREKNFEIKSTVNFSEVEFIDIFSEEKNKCETPDPIKVKDLFTKLGNLNFLNEEERAKLIFLFLWRFYPEIFPEITKHPADSRAPNHSIYDHLVQTSAVFSALPNISFLLFTIGPVQSFIVKARKTSDLWAGSYLLSYLTWESMKPIIEKYGPDTVIYPNLLEQPLVDKHLFEIFKGSSLESLEEEKFKEWITKWQSKSKELKESLVIANMPNRFLAIVPMDKEIGKGCEDNFKEKLKRLSDKVYKTVKNYDRKKEYPSNLDLRIKIEKQLFSYFQVYWVMMPWGKETNDILKEYKLIIGETEVCQTISEIINHPYYKYSNADVGSAYSLLLELTEKLIGMRKSVREFAQLEQPDEKCHLCGEFEVLNLDWDKLKKEKPGLIKENERLCGVCFTKRLFPQILKDELNLSDEIYFPSTSEIASIGEKRRLNNEVKKEFKVRFDEFKSKFKIPLSASVPK